MALSTLSLAASGAYALVIGACALAAMTALEKRQQAWHIRTWIMLQIETRIRYQILC